jgi:two-component system sensor histidine kinase KdpD
MNQLVGKLLGMTRLESPGMKLSKEWYPVEDIVGSALTRLDDVLSGHSVKTDVEADVPLVHADGVLIEEILVNLLENAARYTPRGSTIEIKARTTPEGVRLEVIDNGPGLQPGAENRLFDKFVRDRPPTDRAGTGLGLAICRAIVQLHSGELAAQNRPEGGACFWFTIPKSPDAPPTRGSADDSELVTPAAGSSNVTVPTHGQTA